MFDRRLLTYFDWSFAVAILGMACLGVLSIYSANAFTASPFRQTLHLRQLTWLAVGLCVLVLACTVSYRNLARFAYVIFGLNVFLLLVVLVLGKTGLGAQRWIRIGPITFQPSEFMKLSLVLFLARYFDDRREILHQPKTMLVPAGLTLACAALVLKQPDLGTALLLRVQRHRHHALARPPLEIPAAARHHGRRPRAAPLVVPQGLPAAAHPGVSQSRPGPAGGQLSHRPVEDRRRLGRGVRQGVDGRLAEPAELPPHEPHRFPVRRPGGAVGLSGLPAGLAGVCLCDHPGVPDRRRRHRLLRQPPGHGHHHHAWRSRSSSTWPWSSGCSPSWASRSPS